MIVVNWSKLPLDLLVQIVENHLLAVDDVITFSSVCNSWKRATRACDKSKVRENWSLQMPWLMLTDGNDNEPCYGYEEERMKSEVREGITFDDYEYRGFEILDENPLQKHLYDDKRALLNLSNGRNKSYHLSLPETYGKACWGSRCGWIVTLGLDRKMHMYNPLTKSKLALPCQSTFCYPWKCARVKTIRAMFFCKVVVFRVPQDNHIPWLVVAILNGNSHVGIARPGDTSWKHVYHFNYNYNGPSIMDVIYCNKMKLLVFVDQEASLFYYDVHNPNQPQELKLSLQGRDFIQGIFFPQKQVNTHIYLVQSGDDDLLAIVRFKRKMFWEPNNHHHVHVNCHNYDNFRVFRSRSASWEELKDGIGMSNVAVFVGGNNETMCIDASFGGCQSNCIYFCDVHRDSYQNLLSDRREIVSHSGVFNLTTNNIQPLYDWKIRDSPYCAPFWFTPSLFLS